MDEKKIPTPPIDPSKTLNKSLQFWGAVVDSLDSQFEFMEINHCYGKITVEFKFWNGKMTDKTTMVQINDRVVEEKKQNALDKIL